MTQHPRIAEFDRTALQEQVLREVNDLLGRAEQEAYPPEGISPSKPLVLIVGPPRSGTTLALQWLAASGVFAYPTNLLARFFGAPYLGSRIQQLLTDTRFDYRGELSAGSGAVGWESEVGKTRGMLQPHEFFYYWRRFFPIDQAQKLSAEQLAGADPAGFAAGWGLIERVWDKPIAAKGILLQYDIKRLAEWLPTAIFVHTHRDPFFNMQSLIMARERVFGTREAWFSARPPEYKWLQHEDPYVQVAGQVLFTNRSIDRELAQLPPQRWISLEYESFCDGPARGWQRLSDAMSIGGHALPTEYRGPAAFESGNTVRCSEEDARRLRQAYDHLVDGI